MAVAMTMVWLLIVASYGAEASIGMNWGRHNTQRLLPSQVVDLMLQNGIGRSRVYTSQMDLLEAFSGSGINLTLTILKANALKQKQDAVNWVNRVKPFFIPSNVRSVYLGGYVLLQGITDKVFLEEAWRSLNYLQEAIDETGHGDRVKANFIHMEHVLKPNITKPSEAEFKDEIKPEMTRYLQFLQRHGAPFPIELFPLADIYLSGLDISFAFADDQSTLVITDDANGAVYNNIFQWRYDCFVWAIDKLVNASNINIVVSQVGWPTDGAQWADNANAERFFKHLLPLVTSNTGTPMRPGAPIDVNLHALTDENKMLAYQPFTRHWGIYRSNGQPKYKIDLTGRGRSVYPTTVKGIMRMPKRWCLFNGDISDMTKVKQQLAWVCQKTDCTSTAPGGTCGGLTHLENVSYAFNMYFQTHFQDEAACDFHGLGSLSVQDPSTDSCVFPVEVVKGQQDNYQPTSAAAGERLPHFAVAVGFVLVWFF